MIEYATRLAILTGLALAVATPATAQNLVVNGDFETNGLSGWSVTPVSPGVIAATGQQYVDNAGGSGTGTSLTNTFASFGAGQFPNFATLTSTAFATTVNQAYSLSFDFAQFGTASVQSLSYTVFGGSTLLTGTVQSPGGSNLDTLFSPFTFSFTGSGTPTFVQFTLFPSETVNADGLLDNVIITAIPELGTWLMMIVGMGMTGVGMRRQRRRGAFATV